MMRGPLLACVLLACNSTPSEPAPSEAATTLTPAVLAGKVEVIDAPATGDVKQVVREAMLAAAARQHRVVVDVGASWCEPCGRFREAAKSGQLDADFPGLTLLVFDLDRDRERLHAAGYRSQYIPLLVVPNADGSASAKRMTGSIKGAGAVAEMTPRLRALLTP